jgi:Transglutaminase-like superfamily
MVRTVAMSCFLLITHGAFGTDCNWRDLTAKDTFDLYLADKIVGTLVYIVEHDELSATTLASTDMSISMGAAADNDLEVKEQRRFNVLGSMVSAYQEVSGPSGINSWAVKKSGDQWDYIVIVGGARTSRKAGAIAGNLSWPCRQSQGIKARTIKPGEAWSDTAFEMVSAQNVVTSVRCVDVDTVRHIWTFENVDNLTNRTEKQKIDGSGRVIEESVAGMYVAKNRDKRLAALSAAPESAVAAALQQGKAKDLSELFSVPSDRPKEPEERMALSGADSAFAIDSTVAQWYVHKGKLWVLSNMPAQCVSAGSTPPPPLFRQWLQPTVSMQSDDPKIKELSNKIRGDKKDACAMVEKFTRYVYARLQKRNTATFSNALETLKAGFGDCGEHAVLLGALLRAAGVPARVVLGLVYVEAKKAYMYHAWVMARAGEWVFADAALGAFPAYGNYIPLIIDDTGSGAMRIARLIGRINIKYVTLDGK